MKLTGLWHIYEMDMRDEDYLHMEVQAYIQIKESGSGEFQFGLVTGYIDGDWVRWGLGDRWGSRAVGLSLGRQ